MVALIRELVEINSFTENVEGGRRVGAVLHRELSALGMHVALHESARFAPHLVATTTAAQGTAAGCTALVGHLDTVFPAGSFEGFREDGALFRGPGVLDMKGGLAVILFSLRALAEQGALQTTPLRLVIVSDEEVGSPEGKGVIQASTGGARAALVFEAGRAKDAIICRRKGTGGMRIVASGKAAHAGNQHQDGANAIWALSRAVDRFQSLTDYARGITVNVGRIAGGQSKNTVPDHAEAQVDMRFVRTADGEETLEKMRAILTALDVPGTQVALEGGVARLPLERSDASARLLAAYGDCAHEAGLGFTEAPLIGGGSDASTTSAIGIPSIDGLGPRGTGFHTKDELIERASLVPKAHALALYLARHAGGG